MSFTVSSSLEELWYPESDQNSIHGQNRALSSVPASGSSLKRRAQMDLSPFTDLDEHV